LSKTYFDTVFKTYDWNFITPISLPINPSNEFFRALDYAEPFDLNHRACLNSTCFRYRAAIDKLIWSMITTRPEISYPIIKLSLFATNPATIHYDAVFGIFQYLSVMPNHGLTHTRPKPLTCGPVVKCTHLCSQPADQIDEHVPKENLQTLYGYIDTDWDMDIRHCLSIFGMVIFLAGATIA
jgi:hypothetical protein